MDSLHCKLIVRVRLNDGGKLGENGEIHEEVMTGKKKAKEQNGTGSEERNNQLLKDNLYQNYRFSDQCVAGLYWFPVFFEV